MKIDKNEFTKSLERLKGMAQGGEVAKSQLHHTGSDSEPGQWAGSSWEACNEDDGIDVNGTDYSAVRKALAAKVAKGGSLTPAEVAIAKGTSDYRSILADKVAKGGSLTQAETWALAKGGMFMPKDDEAPAFGKGKDMPGKAGTPGEAKDATSVPQTNAGDVEEEVEANAKKSLESYASASEDMSKGLEASPFLYELTRAIGHALEGTEARVQKSVAQAIGSLVGRIETVEKALQEQANGTEEFNKALSEAVVGIAEQVTATAENITVLKSLPVGAPKSARGPVPGVNAIQKSFDGSGEMQLTKSQTVDALCELNKAQKIPQSEVLKFEAGYGLSPQTEALVHQYVASVRQ